MSRMWLPGEDTKRHLLIEKVNYDSSNSRMFILYWEKYTLYINNKHHKILTHGTSTINISPKIKRIHK